MTSDVSLEDPVMMFDSKLQGQNNFLKHENDRWIDHKRSFRNFMVHFISSNVFFQCRQFWSWRWRYHMNFLRCVTRTRRVRTRRPSIDTPSVRTLQIWIRRTFTIEFFYCASASAVKTLIYNGKNYRRVHTKTSSHAKEKRSFSNVHNEGTGTERHVWPDIPKETKPVLHSHPDLKYKNNMTFKKRWIATHL